MDVELVHVDAADGVRLDGTLRRPRPGIASTVGADAVILHHGVGGKFYGASFYEPIGDAFLSQGCAVLRVNNRGHDLMYNSPKGRLGAAFETVDDCLLDWRAWLDFAADAGFRRIALWGHSLGAVKTVYCLARQADVRVPWAVASSPPRFSYSAYLAMEGAEAFRAYYDQAKRLVDAGNPDGLFATTVPTSITLAARTYIDKYGPEERYDILQHLPNVSLPILVTIGSEEGTTPRGERWFAFGGLAAQISLLAESQPNLTFQLIEGADHFYVGRTTQLWHAARTWLDRVIPAAVA